MIVTLAQLKSALGIAADDATKDAALNNALAQANGLVASYIGFDVSDVEFVHEYTYTPRDYGARDFVHLPLYPVLTVASVLDQDDVPVSPLTYRVVRDKGRVDFPAGVPQVDLLTFSYTAGFANVPAELLPVGLNIASAVYNNGGQLGGTANALKSLTMFDAMSMSFDTTAGVPDAASLLLAWKFVLDKYAVNNGPVLK